MHDGPACTGQRAITASYSGDTNNTAVTSAPLDAPAAVSLLEDGGTAIEITLADVEKTLMIEASGEVDVSQPFVDLRVQVFAPTGIRAVFTEDDSASLIEPAGAMGVFKDGFERQ